MNDQEQQEGESLTAYDERRADENERAAEAAEAIALGVPHEDEWQSAAGFMEYVCATLDRFGVKRPEHYPDDFDPPR